MQVTNKTLSKAAIIITIGILLLALIFGSPSFSVGVALLLVGFPILLLVVSFLVGMFSAWFGMEIISEDKPSNQDVDVVINKELNIIEYGPVIGKLDKEDCYEYIVVKQDHKEIRLEYVGPFDEKVGFTMIDDGWFVVLHDVLYLEPRIKSEVIAV